MPKGLRRVLSRNPFIQSVVRVDVPLRNVPLSVAGTTGVGFGTVPFGDFPAGNILFLGAVSYIRLSTVDSDVQATFDGDYSIGTAPTADATLAGNEVDIVPSTALVPAAGGVSQFIRGANAVQAMFDNTDGSLELNLNVLIDDANISGPGDFLVNGVLHMAYIVLGDD